MRATIIRPESPSDMHRDGDSTTPQSLLVEIGNSTIKTAHATAAGGMEVTRYDDRPAFMAVAAAHEGEILVAVVSPAAGASVLEELRRIRTVQAVERESLREFVGDSYDTPETLGLDRILNLLGLEEDGIVISCGTAVTVDGILAGCPVWGAIMPGFRTAAEGLHARIPSLPRVDPDDPVHMPARTSRGSVANGVLLGTAHAAIGLAHDLASMFTGPIPRITLTGGDAGLLAELWPPPETPHVDDALLFRGMKRTG